MPEDPPLRALIHNAYDMSRRARYDAIVRLLRDRGDGRRPPWDGLDDALDLAIVREGQADDEAKAPLHMNMINPILSAMLDPRFDVNASTIPPLYACVWCGEYDALRIILDARPEIRDRPCACRDNLTAMQRAIVYGRLYEANLLMEYHKDLNWLQPSHWRGSADDLALANALWDADMRRRRSSQLWGALRRMPSDRRPPV